MPGASIRPDNVKSSGFITMPRAAQKIAKALDPNNSGTKICIVIDGVLAVAPARSRDLGTSLWRDGVAAWWKPLA